MQNELLPLRSRKVKNSHQIILESTPPQMRMAQLVISKQAQVRCAVEAISSQDGHDFLIRPEAHENSVDYQDFSRTTFDF
ncbi:MAG: hypothetical protein LBT32_07425 [Peptococcaceae bacterium]|nr:hypothetical protein [Peptococcaceae bacterium]